MFKPAGTRLNLSYVVFQLGIKADSKVGLEFFTTLVEQMIQKFRNSAWKKNGGFHHLRNITLNYAENLKEYF